MSRMPTNYLPCGHTIQHSDGAGGCRLCTAVILPEGSAEWRIAVLIQVLEGLGKDMHEASTRPCATCQAISEALGHAWGCTFLSRRRVPFPDVPDSDRSLSDV